MAVRFKGNDGGAKRRQVGIRRRSPDDTYKSSQRL